MSIDHIELHRLRGELSLRTLSPAERSVVDELLTGGAHIRDRRTLDACNRLADLGLAAQYSEATFNASPFLLDLKRAGLLGVLEGLTR